ncbi:MAG: hypothetical protein ACRDNS_26075, partial [Trebonia sp.]
MKGFAGGPVPAHDPNVQRVRYGLQAPRIKIHDGALVVLVQRLDNRLADGPCTDNDHPHRWQYPESAVFVQVPQLARLTWPDGTEFG